MLLIHESVTWRLIVTDYFAKVRTFEKIKGE